MLTGLTTLFANVFCSNANRLSDANSSTLEFYSRVAFVALLTLWILCQGCYWLRSRRAVRRFSGRTYSARCRRLAEREFRKATSQLKICLAVSMIGIVFSCAHLQQTRSDVGESLPNSERVSKWFQGLKANIVVDGTAQDKVAVGKGDETIDETISESDQIVGLQVETTTKSIEEDVATSEEALVENKTENKTNGEKEADAFEEGFARTNKYGYDQDGNVEFFPFMNNVPLTSSAKIQENLVSESDSEIARLAPAPLFNVPKTRDEQAPSLLRPSEASDGTPARNLQDESASLASRSNVRVVSAAQLDHAFFVENEDHEIQRRLNKNFTPETPLAPFPSTPESPSRSKYRSVDYEERVGDGTSAGLIEGIWSTGDVIDSKGDVEKSILVEIDEESNRISSLVRACVLPIETRKTKANSRVVEEETGCGFLTQYNGKTYVVTNNHVVDHAVSADSIKIFLPNNQTISPIKVFPCDDFDLAALEVSAEKLPKDGSVTLCRFGDSDSVRVANSVFAIGNPFGLEKSLSYGHVSSVRRCNRDLNDTNRNLLPEYIQIDAAINPGNSGGPLYDSRGDVVGIVTAIATTSGKNEGVAFAIPINVALRVVKTTIDGGVWKRSRLGVELKPATRQDLASTNLPYVFGAKIVEVTAAPAQAAGLKPGDVVLAFNGKQVENDVHLARLIALADATEVTRIGVLRGSNYFEVDARLERDANVN